MSFDLSSYKNELINILENKINYSITL